MGENEERVTPDTIEPELKPRGTVNWFAIEMEKRLKECDPRTRDETLKGLWCVLHDEVFELFDSVNAVRLGDTFLSLSKDKHLHLDSIITEATDIANIAMTIADAAKTLKEGE